MKARFSGIEGRKKKVAIICMKLMAKMYEVYQPVIVDGKVIAKGMRDEQERWVSIKKAIHKYEVKTVLDIGCAEGFFTLSAAKECACTATGVDGDSRRLWFATQQALLDGVMNTTFCYANMTPDFYESLNSYDMVLFLSVLHHYIARDGLEVGLAVTKKLLARSRKVMIFESGYSAERLKLNNMPDMGEDPLGWHFDFLRKAGAKDIEVLSESSGYDKSVKRHLLAVTV